MIQIPGQIQLPAIFVSGFSVPPAMIDSCVYSEGAGGGELANISNCTHLLYCVVNNFESTAENRAVNQCPIQILHLPSSWHLSMSLSHSHEETPEKTVLVFLYV